MPRPTWKGSISFGLVNIPVALYPAESPAEEISFRLLDKRNNARVRYERVNEATGEPVPWEKIVKGYEIEEGNYVLLDDKDFERAAVEASKTVEIEDFVKLDEIEYKYFDKPYVLVPTKGGDKGYVLLREALAKSGKVGIAKVVIRTRQYLAAVIPQDNALMLCVLRFADELRHPSEFDLPGDKLSEYKVSQREVDLALQLIDAMSSEWKPEQYHDDYREALMEWIEKKAAAGGKTPATEPEEKKKPAGKIIDIMDLLKKSVEQRERGAAPSREVPRSRAHKSDGKKQARGKSRTKLVARRRAS